MYHIPKQYGHKINSGGGLVPRKSSLGCFPRHPLTNLVIYDSKRTRLNLLSCPNPPRKRCWCHRGSNNFCLGDHTPILVLNWTYLPPWSSYIAHGIRQHLVLSMVASPGVLSVASTPGTGHRTGSCRHTVNQSEHIQFDWLRVWCIYILSNLCARLNGYASRGSALLKLWNCLFLTNYLNAILHLGLFAPQIVDNRHNEKGLF